MALDLNVLSLRIFLSVVETGSLSKTARNLYVSQPSVSAHIRNLERSLNVILLERGPQGAHATEAGELFAHRARDLMHTLSGINDEMAAVKGTMDRRLSVAGTTTLGSHLLPRVIGDFLGRDGEAQTEVLVGNSEQVLQWILEGQAGLGLTFGTVEADEIEVTGLLSERLRLVVDPEHPLAGQYAEPQALTGYRFIVREQGSSTRDSQERALAAWGIPDAPRCTIWTAEAAKEGVWAGLGITLISEHVVGRELRTGTLAEVHVSPEPESREVYLLSAKGFVHSRLEFDFRRHLKELAGWPS